MYRDYAPREYMQLARNTLVEHPPGLPERVSMDDPASFIMVDFTNTRPLTVSSGVLVDEAMEAMVAHGSHTLLVTDANSCLVGMVSACDIKGEAPVRAAEISGLHHSQITVEMIMVPRENIMGISWSRVKSSRVGHIIATMYQLESCYLPVVEDGKMRGMFCGAEISRYVGHDIAEDMACKCAHSFAEIVYALQ